MMVFILKIFSPPHDESTSTLKVNENPRKIHPIHVKLDIDSLFFFYLF